MKRFILFIFFSVIIASSSCKKEYCWICTNQGGFDEEHCGMTEKEAERKEAQGYDCRKN